MIAIDAQGTGEPLAAAIPSCEAHIHPGGGHFSYSRRLTEILDPLVAQAPPPGAEVTELPPAA